jgi:hypothetical protein
VSPFPSPVLNFCLFFFLEKQQQKFSLYAAALLKLSLHALCYALSFAQVKPLGMLRQNSTPDVR